MKTFVVVDNKASEIAYLRRLLSQAFDGWGVSELGGGPQVDWDAVVELVERDVADGPDTILVCDLALNSSRSSGAQAGVAACHRIRKFRPRCVMLGWTEFPNVIRTRGEDEGLFDGIIDKTQLTSFRSQLETVNHVRGIVKAACAKRESPDAQTNRIDFADGLGMRIAQMAIGEDALVSLTEAVAGDWTGRRVRALTSGFSGAHLLVIRGSERGRIQELVLKCASKRAIIEGDIVRRTLHIAELGALAQHLVEVDAAISEIPGHAVYYYRQVRVEGDDALSLLSSQKTAARGFQLTKKVVALEIENYRRAVKNNVSEESLAAYFQLSGLDRSRAANSLEELCESASVIHRVRGGWPKRIPAPKEIVQGIEGVIGRWSALLSEEDGLPVVVQHGDLNPGNLMLTKKRDVVLIDLSRLGPWPMGYDLARLAMSLRLRLLGCGHRSDWVANGLIDWHRHPVADLESGAGSGSEVCPWALCDSKYLEFLTSDDRSKLRGAAVRGYQIASMWDLVKVLSYQNVSEFKRIWAMIQFWRLAHGRAWL